MRFTPPSAVILDIHLPGLSGLEFLEGWKRERETREIPVICFTADADRETRERAEALGCAAFITKPNEPHCVLHALEERTTRDGCTEPPDRPHPHRGSQT